MDEITMFARLRPDDTLTEADLDNLRAELFPRVETRAPLASNRRHDLAALAPSSGAPESSSRFGLKRSSRIVLTAAVAAAVTAMGLGGLWLVTDRHDGAAPATPAYQPASSLTTRPAAPPAGSYDIPLIGFAEPGWTVTSASDDLHLVRRAVLLLSDAAFDGPWIEITAEDRGFGIDSTNLSGDRTVDIDGATAQVVDIENGVVLHWNDADGNAIEAFGWHVDLDQVVTVARHLSVTDAAVTIDQLPAEASLADAAASAALGHHATYSFTHPDGHQVEVTFRAGASRGLYQMQGSTADRKREGRIDVTIGGQPATIIGYPDLPAESTASAAEAGTFGGRYRVDMQRGFWTWEFNTVGFDSEQQVIDLVAGATVVDLATWSSSLADNVIAPERRAAALEDVLDGVPLPPGFDADLLTTGGTDDRYQFIAEVSAAVGCGWFDEWFAGDASGDTARQATAAAALASSHDWSMLNEIANHGGWSQILWGYADAINGIEETGGIDEGYDATPRNVHDALACDRFG